jgi:hypothetical protein
VPHLQVLVTADEQSEGEHAGIVVDVVVVGGGTVVVVVVEDVEVVDVAHGVHPEEVPAHLLFKAQQ